MSDKIHQQPIAIVGMGCRLPGGQDLDSYWNLIKEGRSAIRELPPSRLNTEIYYSAESRKEPYTSTRLGAIVEDYKGIRNLHRLTLNDVRAADPSHLELVGVMEDALDQAGWVSDYLSSLRTGVYVGHTRGTGRCGELVYRSLVPQTAKWLRDVHAFQSLDRHTQDLIVERVIREVQERYPAVDQTRGESLEAFQGGLMLAKAFDLQGPTLSLNAACASALFSLSLAGQALRLGQIDAAVVGSGSFVEFDSLVLFSQAGSVSRTGSRPFDASADGLVAAEGYVIILLKTLKRAIADGDNVLAVIRGMGYSSDGRGKSLWAPRKEGQVLAIQRAFGSALSPKRLQYVEAHATSTAVGDATELTALNEVFAPHFSADNRVPIGSVKANIGHTLETAGLAGLVKAVLAIQHRTIPSVAYVTKPNPKIEWSSAPFFLPPKNLDWQPNANGLPRRAGVNAFGIGGLNAHIVLDEYLQSYHENYFQPDSEVNLSSACEVAKSRDGRSVADAQVGCTPNNELTDRESLIAVIGMGVIAPGGKSAHEFWQNTKEGQCHFVEPSKSRFDRETSAVPGLDTVRVEGGFLNDYTYDWKKHKVPPKQVANADPLQFMLLDAVDQALRDTQIPLEQLPREKTGVIVGSVFGGEFGNALQMGLRLPEFFDVVRRQLQTREVNDSDIDTVLEKYQELLVERMPALVDETGSFTSSTLASRITKSFDVMGGGAAIDAGGNSGVATLTLAMNSLRAGEADVMICATGQRSCGQFAIDQLLLKKELSTESGATVWRSEDGRKLAEGVAVVVLKRLSDAQRDGNRVYSVLCDTQTAIAPALGDAFAQVHSGLLSDAYIACGDHLRYIEACSNGTEDDRAELDACSKLAKGFEQEKVRVCSLKDQIGDSTGASAMLAVIRASSALFEGVLPAVAEARTKKLPSGVFCSEQSEQVWQKDSPSPGYALVHSCCENQAAGVLLCNLAAVDNVAVKPVPSKTKPPRASENSASERIQVSENQTAVTYRFAADTVSELLADLSTAIANIDKGAKASAKSREECSAWQYRLNVVASNAASLKNKLQMACHTLEQGKSLSNLQGQAVFFGQKSTSTRPEVAFLFSGQGSQYRGMLSSWLSDLRSACPERNQIEEVLKSTEGVSLAELFADETGKLGSDLRATQLAILGSQILLHRVATEAGITPDRIAGHSFGEYAAMYAAGVWSIPHTIDAALVRSDAVRTSELQESRLLCVFCDEEMANEGCRSSGCDAYVANCNSPMQTVIGVSTSEADALRKWFESKKVRTVLLPVPYAFHTPLLMKASETMARLASRIEFSACHLPLLSTVSESYESNESRLRQNLIEQFVRPVRWTRMIDKLYRDGVRLFVEIGPGQVLTNLTRNILRDTSDVLCVATDDSKGTVSDQIQIMYAAREIFEHIYAKAGSDGGQSVRVPAFVAKSANSSVELGKDPESVTGLSTLASTAKSHTFARREMVSAKLASTGKQSSSSFMRGLEEVGLDYQRQMESLLLRLPTVKSFIDIQGWKNAEALLGSYGIKELESLADRGTLSFENLLALNYSLTMRNDSRRAHFLTFSHASNAVPCLHGIIDAGMKSELILRRYSFDNQCTSAVWGHAGQIGGLAGMNDAGISISCIRVKSEYEVLNAPRQLQSIVTLHVLAHARSLADAIELCRSHRGLGDWNVLLLDGKSSTGSYIELRGNQSDVREVREKFSATNEFHSAKEQATNISWERNTTQLIEGALAKLNGDSSDPNAVSEALGVIRRRSDWSAAHQSSPGRGFHELLLSPKTGQAWLDSVEMLTGLGGSEAARKVEYGGSDIASSTRQVTESQKEPQASSGVNQRLRSVRITAAELAKAGNSCDGKPPLGDHDKICTRLAVRLVSKPIGSRKAEQAHFQNRKVLVLGRNAVSKSFSDQLVRLGATVECLEVHADYEAMLQEHDQFTSTHGSIDDLVWLHAWDSLNVAESTSWEKSVLAPYWVAQRWFGNLGDTVRPIPATFAVATRMGGDLGFGGTSSLHTGGAHVGLSKAMFLERSVMVGNDLRSLAVDFSIDAEPEVVARRLLEEMTAEEREGEIAYENDLRHVIRMVHSPLDSIPSGIGMGTSVLERNGCWIVTGGARGVTAEIAKALGRSKVGTIHLVGSSPLPAIPAAWLDFNDVQTRELRTEIVRQAVAEKKTPADAWSNVEKAIEISKNLRRMTDEGLQVQYHACDISSQSNVDALLQKIRAKGEPIVGIVHGAGYEKASRFTGKKSPLVRRTIESKVIGALNLISATQADNLAVFAAFTSISGRYGAIGQTDYSMSNEWLTKIVARLASQRPDSHCVALDWHSWDEVGMAARPETKHSKLLASMKFMPVAEGVQHFVNEIRNRSEETEVVITDWEYHKMFFPDPVSPIPAKESAESLVDRRPDSSVAKAVEDDATLSLNVWDLESTEAIERAALLTGSAIILGQNATADALQKQLLQQGVDCLRIANLQVDKVENLICSFADGSDELHLFVLTALDSSAMLGAGIAPTRDRIDRGIRVPGSLISRILDRIENSSSVKTITIAANMGGAFGLSNRVYAPESSAFMQLVESDLGLVTGLEAKLVDLALQASPSERAELILREASCHDRLRLIAYPDGRRSRLVRRSLSETAGTSRSTMRPGVWLVVGHGLQSYQAELECLASSMQSTTMEPIDVATWDAGQTIPPTSNATELWLLRVNWLQSKIRQIRASSDDSIRGVVFVGCANSATRCRNELVNVQILAELYELTQPDDLDAFLVWNYEPSSPMEQLECSAMTGWVRWYSALRPEVRAIAIDGLLQSHGARAGAGVASFLALQSQETEYAFEVAKTTNSVASGCVNRSRNGVPEFGFINQVQRIDDSSFVAEIALHPVDDPFLAQHIFRGRPLLPMVAIAEIFSQAVRSSGWIPDGRFALSELKIVNGLRFLDDNSKSVRVLLNRHGDRIELSLNVSFFDSRGKLVDPNRQVASAHVVVTDTVSKSDLTITPSMDLTWYPVTYPGPESLIYHGEAFRSICHVQHFENGLYAKFVAKASEDLVGGHRQDCCVPMSLVDSSLFACGILTWIKNPAVAAIPAAIDKLVVHSLPRLGERCVGKFILKESHGQQAVFDGLVCTENGKPIVSIFAYRANLVGPG